MLATKLTLAFLLTTVAMPPRTESDERLYLNYARALNRNPGAPVQYFLVVRVKNLNTGLAREYCTKGGFLQGALHQEYSLTYDARGIAKAHRLAISNRQRYFEFKNDSALANINLWAYSMHNLAQFEQRHNLDSLAAAIRSRGNWHLSKSDSVMRLYAHALFNRGILTGESTCFSDGIHYIR